MDKIPYTHIKELFASPLNVGVTALNVDFNGQYWFNGRVVDDEVSIQKCRFWSSLQFMKVSFKKGVKFIDCHFYKGAYLDEVTCNGSMEFINCVFDDELFIGNSLFGDLSFDQVEGRQLLLKGGIGSVNSRYSTLSIKGGKYEVVRIEEAEIKKKIRILGVSMGSLHVLGAKILSSLFIADQEDGSSQFLCKDVVFESSEFFGRIDFSYGMASEQIYFHKVSFHEQFVFRSSFHVNLFSWVEVSARFNASLEFLDNISSLNISDCRFDNTFMLRGVGTRQLHRERVRIQFNGSIYGNYIIDYVTTLSIDLSCINFGNLIFRDSLVKFIWISGFYNFNKVLFSNVLLDPKYTVLLVKRSNLGNMEFENIDFRRFDEVVIIKSDVSTIQLTNSIFPIRIQIETRNPQIGVVLESNELQNRNLYYKESYRQLRLAMERLGNRYYALAYKSKEMYYQRKELRFTWDKILLWINFISNNNGISWTRGILFTISCSFLFFLLLITTLDDPIGFICGDSEQSVGYFIFNLFDRFVIYFSSYPELKIPGLDSNKWKVSLIILLSRIFVSIGIYQTISAFRKYSK